MRPLLFLFVLHVFVEAKTTTHFQLTVHFDIPEPRELQVSLWEEDSWYNPDDLLAWTSPRKIERCGEKWQLKGAADTEERQPYELYLLLHFNDPDGDKCCRVPLGDCQEPGPCNFDFNISQQAQGFSDKCRPLPDGYGPMPKDPSRPIVPWIDYDRSNGPYRCRQGRICNPNGSYQGPGRLVTLPHWVTPGRGICS